MAVFDYEQPAAGRGRFFGRETLMRALLEGLGRGRSFAVCGGPRTGRTSVLRQLVVNVDEQWRLKARAAKVVPVLIELGKAATGGPRGLPAVLWEAVTRAIADPRIAGDKSPALPAADFKKTKDAWAHLADLGERHWERLRNTPAWCQWALLVDDGDLLFDRRLEAALEPIAKMLKGGAAWAPRCLVIAGGRALREHLLEQEAALGFARPMALGVLREPEAEKLVKSGITEPTPELLQGLLHTSGRHPWALQRLASEIEQQGVGIGVEGAVDGAARDFLELFERLWGQFDLERGVTYRGAYAAPEHALMQLLVDSGEPSDVKSAERDLGIRPLKEYAEMLEYLGVAERALLGDNAQIRAQFELWNVWYRERVMR